MPKTRKTARGRIFLTALVTGALLLPAGAQERGSGNEVSLGGEVILRIRTGAGGMTAEQRAAAVRERLVPILSLTDLKPADVTVRQKRPNQDAAIYVRDRLLITVDRNLAQANGDTDPFNLAIAWAARLRQVLPQVNVRVNPGGV